MKIAITASGPDPAAAVDRRSGRCQYFLIVDPDSMACETVENPNVALGQPAAQMPEDLPSNGELEWLKQRSQALAQQLEQIRARIGELEAGEQRPP